MNASNGSGAAEKHWVARIPRRVVIHRMETADSLESRLFWAIVLWSLCGPQRSQGVVIKNEYGFIQEDSSKNPVPAKAQDLLRLLGLADGMKGHLSRALKRLKAKGSIYFKNKILYLTEDPTPPDKTQEVAINGNWNIAGVVVNIGNLPTDPTDRNEAIEWLNKTKIGYNTGLKTFNIGYRKLLRTGLSERGILISLEEKRRRREERAPCSEVISVNGSSSSSVPTAEPTTTNSPLTGAPEPPAETPRPVDTAPIVAALEPHGTPEPAVVERMVEDCRKEDPACTGPEIAEAIRTKAKQKAGAMMNPIGFLLAAVPKCFAAGAFRKAKMAALERQRKKRWVDPLESFKPQEAT